MLITILLFLVYLVIFSFIISRSSFLHAGGLTTKFLLVYFYFSSAIGLGHLYLAWRYFPGHGDIWYYFEEGLWVRDQLLSGNFYKAMHVVPESGELLDSDSGLGKFQYRVIALIQTILSFFSFKNNYISTFIFGFLLLFGKVAFYNGFRMLTVDFGKGAGLAFLLIPSVIFWTGVIYKEGLLYMLLGIIVYQLANLRKKGQTWRWGIFILCLTGIFLIRNFLLPILVLTLAVAAVMTIRSLKTRLITGMIALAVLVGSLFLFPVFWNSFASLIAQKQASFLALEGNSRMPLDTIGPGPAGLLRALPNAFINGFLMPYPGQFPNFLYSLFGFEMYAILLLLACGLITFWRKGNNGQLPVWWGTIVFGILGILVIGYIVPFAGALVRYRSIYLPFLLFAGLIGIGSRMNSRWRQHIIK